MEIILIGFILVTAAFVFGIWWSGLAEQRRIETLIRNTQPIGGRFFRREKSPHEKTTRIEGFRTRVRQFKTTLIGVGKPG